MKMTDLEPNVIAEMKAVFGDDQRRIDHALAVLDYAKAILATEPAADETTVVAAAVLHDIGIHAAEARHNSNAGHWQEIEGPPIAGPILARLGLDPARIDHVLKIIANHHSARDIDTVEFRILWDSDWLVNIPDEYDVTDRTRMATLVDKVFKTQGGRAKAAELFLQ